MILYNSAGEKIIAKAVPQPKFADRGGRTWDARKVSIDGEKMDFIYDSSRGMAFYFEQGERWYKASIFDPMDTDSVGVYESRQLFTQKPPTKEEI